VPFFPFVPFGLANGRRRWFGVFGRRCGVTNPLGAAYCARQVAGAFQMPHETDPVVFAIISFAVIYSYLVYGIPF
jgi:hypothetical protein